MKRTLPFFLRALCVFVGCNRGSKPIVVAFSVAAEALDNGQSVNITVQVMHGKNGKGVTFTFTGPSKLSGQTPTSVTYNAPASGTGTAMLTATSAPDTTKSATNGIHVSV